MDCGTSRRVSNRGGDEFGCCLSSSLHSFRRSRVILRLVIFASDGCLSGTDEWSALLPAADQPNMAKCCGRLAATASKKFAQVLAQDGAHASSPPGKAARPRFFVLKTGTPAVASQTPNTTASEKSRTISRGTFDIKCSVSSLPRSRSPTPTRWPSASATSSRRPRSRSLASPART